jgi:hypothetical protein
MLFVSFLANAQLTDLARIEYSFIPKKKSDDQYTRLRALFNYPIKIKEDSYLIIGTEFNRIFLNLKDQYPFDTSLLENINVIDFNLAYTHKISDNWRVAYSFTPRLAATLTKKITKEDFFINGGLFFIKDRTKDKSLTKPYRLTLGLTYNTTAGVPFPLPLINYFRQVDDKWSYTIGVPKMNLKYKINKVNSLQSFVGIDVYFAHLKTPIIIDNKEADNISLSLLVAGLGYEYQFTKHLVWFAYSGYTVRLSNVLRDKDRKNVYTLNDVNAFYLRTGIKFKL